MNHETKSALWRRPQDVADAIYQAGRHIWDLVSPEDPQVTIVVIVVDSRGRAASAACDDERTGTADALTKTIRQFADDIDNQRELEKLCDSGEETEA